MNTKKLLFLICFLFSGKGFLQLQQTMGQTSQDNKNLVKETSGLVAFWDFESKSVALDRYIAHSSLPESAIDVANNALYPISLKKHGDAQSYTVTDWVQQNASTPIHEDTSGPFGNAIKLDAGRLFAEVQRSLFNDKPLADIHGHQPFTLITWVKFHGPNNHHIVGIWDEGEAGVAEKKYSGQRQFALFTINRYPHKLFAHFSATGAATYPQSLVSGSQYAHLRAVNGVILDHAPGEGLSNVSDKWYQFAMTYDGNVVCSYVNGVLENFSYINQTNSTNSDHVLMDVEGTSEEALMTNPNPFDYSIYRPRKFIVKFNGNYHNNSQVKEHYIDLDFVSANKTLTYKRVGTSNLDYYIEYAIKRNDATMVSGNFTATSDEQLENLPTDLVIEEGDVLELRLKENDDNGTQIGNLVRREIGDGAPFSFGKILGGPNTGAQVHMDGAAIFNRAFTPEELGVLIFDPTLSVASNTIVKGNSVSVYPNPGKELLIVRFDAPSIINADDSIITIYNITGKVINDLPNQRSGVSVKYDIQNLNGGVYIISVRNGDQVVNKLFIKE